MPDQKDDKGPDRRAQMRELAARREARDLLQSTHGLMEYLWDLKASFDISDGTFVNAGSSILSAMLLYAWDHGVYEGETRERFLVMIDTIHGMAHASTQAEAKAVWEAVDAKLAMLDAPQGGIS